MIARLAAVAGLTAAAATARAEAPAARAPVARPDTASDPAALEAGDANLESTADRTGITFAASLGGGLLIGFGIKDSVGRGGSASLRLGHVATRRTVITLELDITAALHRPTSATMTSSIQTNTNTDLLLGAQYYVHPSLWLHVAVGVGGYQGRQVVVSGIERGDVTLIGPAVLFGVGIDLARFKWAVLGFEIATTAMVNSDGVLVGTSGGLGLAFD
jgi:hypothetical protein